MRILVTVNGQEVAVMGQGVAAKKGVWQTCSITHPMAGDTILSTIQTPKNMKVTMSPMMNQSWITMTQRWKEATGTAAMTATPMVTTRL